MNALVPTTNAEAYKASTDAAGLCRDIVIASAMEIQQRRYVKVEGWQAIKGTSVTIALGLGACDKDPRGLVWENDDVVVVGGGYGGATAARYLKLWGGNVDVTLVERSADFVSCPISNLVLGGYRSMRQRVPLRAVPHLAVATPVSATAP